MSHLAKVADSGFHDASAYDAHRPSYRPEVVSSFLSRLRVLDGTSESSKLKPAKIVEIGAGTGKFTELLSRKAVEAAAGGDGGDGVSFSGPSIIAVEPHAQMRAQLAAKHLPHVTVVDGHGADLATVDDGTADAVVVAQAFHWFANLEALGETRRVLKPGAFVGVIWNIEDYNKPAAWPANAPYEQALNDIILSLAPDGSRRFRDGTWQQAFHEAARADPATGRRPWYSPLASDRIAWTVDLTPEALWKRLLTLSQIANLPEEGPNDDDEAADPRATPSSRKTVRRRLDAVLARDDVAQSPRGEVTIHAVSFFAWAQKTADAVV